MTDVVKIDKYYATKLFPKRNKNSNKGTFGTVLNVAGSIYYSGAAYFSSIAPLKVGAGLVRLATESSVMQIVASKCSDITYIDLGETEYGTISKDGLKYLKNIPEPSAISIGCGLSTIQPVREFTVKFLKNYSNSSVPIVIDADAINIMSEESNPLFPLNSVITPHPKELSRLINVSVDVIQSDRVKWANYASTKFDCIVILKGRETVISIPNGNTFVNTTGNSGLSHAGTGDVLTGMISGFAAQGMKLEDASVLGAYLHGYAADLGVLELSEYSFLASDLIRYIPKVMKEFQRY